MPTKATTGSAGYDLYSVEELTIEAGCRAMINTGIILEIPEGLEGQIRSRSGLAIKHGISVLNSPGTIDSDYRGEIKVILYNSGKESFLVQPGMRIAQLVFSQYMNCMFVLSDNLTHTERGVGGFGSTG